MDTLTFIIPGLPRGKGRPRFSTFGGFARAYTDAKTRSYEAEVKAFAQQAGAKINGEPCSIEFLAVFPIPKSYSKKKRAAAESGLLKYTKKPDTDNISKVKDALNNVAYVDDSQVYKETIMKIYGLEPRLQIKITYDYPL